jgi:tetratricopeptide (TPR) repeat protein
VPSEERGDGRTGGRDRRVGRRDGPARPASRGARESRDAGERRGARGGAGRPGDTAAERGRVDVGGQRGPVRPELPPDTEAGELDAEVRRELRTLPKGLAELVGGHLVAVGRLIDEDPQAALAHARFARSRASRVGAVREAAGLAAYHAGEWNEAVAELRAAKRLSGRATHLAVLADCERALGRPQRALEIARDPEARGLAQAEAVELRIVAAGARRDLSQLDAAVVALQGPELEAESSQPWLARLRYAYADNLLAAGRTEDAIRWFLAAADSDTEGETDAAERAAELGDRTAES